MRNFCLQAPRSFWYSVGLVITFNSCFLVLLILAHPGTQQNGLLLDDLGQIASAFLSALLCFIVVKKSVRQKQENIALPSQVSSMRLLQFWIPLLFGSGECGQMIGQIIYFYNQLYHLSPFPAWSDVGYLGSDFFFLSGILLLPTCSLSKATRSRILLDGLMILTAIITFSWYFTLGPTLLQASTTLLATVVGTAYPAFDLILICCTIILLLRSVHPSLRPALSVLMLSFLIIVSIDSVYDYQMLQGTYMAGWQDIGWPLGYMLLALSVQLVSWSPHLVEDTVASSQASSQAPPSLWRTMLPYTLIPMVLLLVFYIWHAAKQDLLVMGVYGGGAILLALIFARQLLAIHEIHQLNDAFSIANTTLYATQLTLHQKNMELSTANDRLAVLATTDPLTALPNHRAVMNMLGRELEYAQQHAHFCTILFLDIDHFKALNDGYGHAGGDTALQEFSQVICSTIGSSNIVGRWGGEEFVAILPTLSCEDALNLAEHIRSAVSHHLFTVGGGIHLTCSIGVASFPQHTTVLETLVSSADQAMYRAKNLGRNLVCSFCDPAMLASQEYDEVEGGREEAALSGTVAALMKLITIHEPATSLHCQQASELLSQLAHAMSLSASEAHMLAVAGQLHDLGNIAIPDRLLQKTGPLTAEEWRIIRIHPATGAKIIESIPALRTIAPVIRSHHEYWNGLGYPDNLVAEAIPLGARMLAVVNAYIVLTTDRPYQQACDPASALKDIQRDAGSRFDPGIVAALSDLLQAHPQMAFSSPVSFDTY